MCLCLSNVGTVARFVRKPGDDCVSVRDSQRISHVCGLALLLASELKGSLCLRYDSLIIRKSDVCMAPFQHVLFLAC